MFTKLIMSKVTDWWWLRAANHQVLTIVCMCVCTNTHTDRAMFVSQ